MTLTQLITTKQQEARGEFLNAFGGVFLEGAEYPEKTKEEAFSLIEELILSTAHSVLDAVKELVPEARTRDYYRPAGGEYKEGEHDGWNELRHEFLSRLERFSSNEE